LATLNSGMGIVLEDARLDHDPPGSLGVDPSGQ
jgi:hypothetical protein